MPTINYIYKEKYFFITSDVMLDVELPDSIKDKLGYFEMIEGEKIYFPMTLGDAVQIKRELEDGTFALSIQLSPNSLLSIKCVLNYITEKDFNEALANYSVFGIAEFLTLEEFKQLKFKQDVI